MSTYPWEDRPAAEGRKANPDYVPGDPNAVPPVPAQGDMEVETTAEERETWAIGWGFKSWQDWQAFLSIRNDFPQLGVPTEPFFSHTLGVEIGKPLDGATIVRLLGKQEGASSNRARAWFGASYQLVVDFARSAPGNVKAMATVQTARYLANSPHGQEQVQWSGSAGNDGGSSSYMVTSDAGINAFRRSGAMALLARYKRRRAAVVGG